MYRLEEMTWPQAEAYFQNNDEVLLVTGSIESHGRQNPLGTDLLIPKHITEMIQDRTDILLAPPMPYGCTQFLSDFPGTVDLGHDAYYMVMKQITESLRKHGARHFIVLNGHGGNNPVLDRVGLDLYREGCLMAEVNWWTFVWNLCPGRHGETPWHGGHGAAEETSAMMAVNEDLVDRKELETPSVLSDLSPDIKGSGFRTVRYKGVDISVSRPTRDVTDNGWVGEDDPKESSRAWGEEMLTAMADWLTDFIAAFKKAQLPEASE